ncbi:MAG: SMC-Scp complex subunit ScpB [bacterium]|nr:SMC-Scp complex subunit ScpB [bacterium]
MNKGELKNKIEAILLFKNEPLSYKDISKILDADIEEVKSVLLEMLEGYRDSGLTLVMSDSEVSFGTNPKYSALIESVQKEELSRDLGRAGLETLSIILYKGPISRRELDYIRGVNSGFIIRNLLIRGLIERSENATGERSYTYKTTLELLRHLGISKKEDLPNFDTAFKKLDEFSKTLNVDESSEAREDGESDRSKH